MVAADARLPSFDGKYAFPAMNFALPSLDQTQRTHSYPGGWRRWEGGGGEMEQQDVCVCASKGKRGKIIFDCAIFSVFHFLTVALKCAGRSFAVGPGPRSWIRVGGKVTPARIRSRCQTLVFHAIW